MNVEPAYTSRPSTDTRPPRTRSAVTNGRRLFVEGDGNSAWSRRYKDLILGHVNDLGGHDLLSEAQLSLIRRTAAIECELEQIEGRLSRGEPIDLEGYARTAGHLRRLLETLGLERRPRDLPTLQAYLAARPAKRRADAADAETEATVQAQPENPISGLPNSEAAL